MSRHTETYVVTEYPVVYIHYFSQDYIKHSHRITYFIQDSNVYLNKIHQLINCSNVQWPGIHELVQYRAVHSRVLHHFSYYTSKNYPAYRISFCTQVYTWTIDTLPCNTVRNTPVLHCALLPLEVTWFAVLAGMFGRECT